MLHWIKLRKSISDDPRVLGLASRLKVKPTEIIGCLTLLWFCGDTHSTDGKLPNLTPDALDKQVGLKGFSAELVKTGWLVFSEQGAEIVKFLEHNGDGAKRRAQDAKRNAELRTKKTSLADGVSN
jgi:hypothetical protein